MIEAKLLVGRFLQFNPTASRPLPALPYVPDFQDVFCPPLKIKESNRKDPGAWYNPMRNAGGQRQSTIKPGTNATKEHRNFKWLPWYAGDIAETTLDCDVLTGPMSGCVLVLYNKGTARKVGHIGTVTVTDAIPDSVNTNVKTVWTNWAKANRDDVIGGFNPRATTVPGHGAWQGDDVGGQTWGLITTLGAFYAVHVWVQKGTADHFRIDGVHQVPSMSKADLLAL
jgi:hypothetical protein